MNLDCVPGFLPAVPCFSPLSLETPFSCFPLFSPFSLGRLLIEAAPLDFLENTFPLEQALERFDRFFYVAVVDVYVHSFSFSIFWDRRPVSLYRYLSAGGPHQR